jgi:hypothetical protein
VSIKRLRFISVMAGGGNQLQSNEPDDDRRRRSALIHYHHTTLTGVDVGGLKGTDCTGHDSTDNCLTGSHPGS